MNNFIIFQLPIDLVSALGGALIGFILVLIYEYLIQPRILFWNIKIIDEHFNIGYNTNNQSKNYKLKFKVSGLRSPGFCELQIRWCGNVVKAKWDDNPNPLVEDNSEKFEPALVPQTYLNTVMLWQWYKIPITNVENNIITVFDGWWFGKRLKLQYGPNPVVNNNTEITFVLKGNNLTWEKKLTVQEILDKKLWTQFSAVDR